MYEGASCTKVEGRLYLEHLIRTLLNISVTIKLLWPVKDV